MHVKALETIASGDHAPEVLRIAREALKELNVSAVPDCFSQSEQLPGGMSPFAVVTLAETFQELRFLGHQHGHAEQ